MNFFNKFPTVTYNNKLTVNILSRVKISDQSLNTPELFLPYTLTDGDRIDLLSQAYYNSPKYTWLVWLSNNVIDPYYSFAISEDEFIDFIVKKYGSVANAQRKIAHYRINYRSDSRVISVSQFNNLPTNEKKYWEPEVDYLFNVRTYKRKQDDQIAKTNSTATFRLENVTGQFKTGEEITNNSSYGFCTFTHEAELTIQNIQGVFTPGETIYGKESGASATVQTYTVVATTIALNEISYWEPVTHFDVELEQNESRKEINMIDVRFADRMERDLKRALSS